MQMKSNFLPAQDQGVSILFLALLKWKWVNKGTKAEIRWRQSNEKTDVVVEEGRKGK